MTHPCWPGPVDQSSGCNIVHGRQRCYFPVQKGGLFGGKRSGSCQQFSTKIRLLMCISIMTHCCLKFISQGRTSKVDLFREIFSVWIYFFCCRGIIIQCSLMELQWGNKPAGNPEQRIDLGFGFLRWEVRASSLPWVGSSWHLLYLILTVRCRGTEERFHANGMGQDSTV